MLIDKQKLHDLIDETEGDKVELQLIIGTGDSHAKVENNTLFLKSGHDNKNV